MTHSTHFIYGYMAFHIASATFYLLQRILLYYVNNSNNTRFRYTDNKNIAKPRNDSDRMQLSLFTPLCKHNCSQKLMFVVLHTRDKNKIKWKLALRRRKSRNSGNRINFLSNLCLWNKFLKHGTDGPFSMTKYVL